MHRIIYTNSWTIFYRIMMYVSFWIISEIFYLNFATSCVSTWKVKRDWFNFTCELYANTFSTRLSSFFYHHSDKSFARDSQDIWSEREENAETEKGRIACAFIDASLHNWTDISTLFISSWNDGRGLRRSRGRGKPDVETEETKDSRPLRYTKETLVAGWQGGRTKKETREGGRDELPGFSRFGASRVSRTLFSASSFSLTLAPISFRRPPLLLALCLPGIVTFPARHMVAYIADVGATAMMMTTNRGTAEKWFSYRHPRPCFDLSGLTESELREAGAKAKVYSANRIKAGQEVFEDNRAGSSDRLL